MTIQEVLDADMDIDRIKVVIRRKDLLYVMGYCIGKDVKPGHYERLVRETKAGAIYTDADMKTLYMDRILNHYQLEVVPQSQIGLHGVIEKEIPRELRRLEVYWMQPYHTGSSDGLHGYFFTCVTDHWTGIAEEYEQKEMEGVTEENGR